MIKTFVLFSQAVQSVLVQIQYFLFVIVAARRRVCVTKILVKVVYVFQMSVWELGLFLLQMYPKNKRRLLSSLLWIAASICSIYPRRIQVGLFLGAVLFHMNSSIVFLGTRAEIELGKIIERHSWKRSSFVVTTKIYWSTK